MSFRNLRIEESGKECVGVLCVQKEILNITLRYSLKKYILAATAAAAVGVDLEQSFAFCIAALQQQFGQKQKGR